MNQQNQHIKSSPGAPKGHSSTHSPLRKLLPPTDHFADGSVYHKRKTEGNEKLKVQKCERDVKEISRVRVSVAVNSKQSELSSVFVQQLFLALEATGRELGDPKW